jgi:hypothetical protein
MKSFKSGKWLSMPISTSSFDKFSVLAPFIVFTSMLIGVAFYSIVNGWDIALSYFFAASVLFGDMYLIPTEPNPWSPIFTLFYFLWGTTLLAGAITAAANMVVTSAVRIAAEERKRLFDSKKKIILDEDLDQNVVVGFLAQLISYFEWSKYKMKYLSLLGALFWFLLGVLYGIFFEKWTLSKSMQFALALICTAANVPPTCEGIDNDHCTVGTIRSLFLGTYMMIGVPFFAYTVAQFAEILVERAIKANEERLLLRPLSLQEFEFVAELQQGHIVLDNDEEDDEVGVEEERKATAGNTSSNSHLNRRSILAKQKQLSITTTSSRTNHSFMQLTFEDFIILEMLRLEKITVDDLKHMKELYDIIYGHNHDHLPPNEIQTTSIFKEEEEEEVEEIIVNDRNQEQTT